MVQVRRQSAFEQFVHKNLNILILKLIAVSEFDIVPPAIVWNFKLLLTWNSEQSILTM